MEELLSGLQNEMKSKKVQLPKEYFVLKLMQSGPRPERFMSKLQEDLLHRYSCSHHIPPQCSQAMLQQRSGPGLHNTDGSLGSDG